MGHTTIIVNESPESCEDDSKLLTQILKQLKQIEKTMATKAELQAVYEDLRSSIANVSADIDGYVDKLENYVPDDVLAEGRAIAADLKAVADKTPEPSTEEPNEEEPVEEEPVDEGDPVDEEPIE